MDISLKLGDTLHSVSALGWQTTCVTSADIWLNTATNTEPIPFDVTS